MGNLVLPWVDGEKIPDERVREIFRPPPGVPTRFYRSTLVIGSRGVGKTTLFRYSKETHVGLAVHISLATEFASLTKQTGLGPLGLDYPRNLEHLVVGKATTLLALAFVGRLLKKGVAPPLQALVECIPSDLLCVPQVIDGTWVTEARTTVARAPLEAFEGVSRNQPLPSFASSLGTASLGQHGPLLLLLDRADMVPAAFLTPVIQLLDQSSNYVALVAMRPGHAGRVIADTTQGAVPGDHYGVVHLGASPYSAEWASFMEGAIEAQLGHQAVTSLPADTTTGILTLSRDSLRTGLELFARCQGSLPPALTDELHLALDDLRENQLVAAQQTLQRHHHDFRKLVNDLRDEVLQREGSISGPVLLAIDEGPRQNLFQGSDRLDNFLDAALRSGALSMPDGERWVPGLKPRKLEVPPLLFWEKGDPFWTPSGARPTTIKWDERRVFHISGGTAPQPSIFVAYRMNFEESIAFRNTLGGILRSHPDLSEFEVVDGRVPCGAKWADTIRDRIRRARAVVGDVTGMRADVLFELGFAYGLRKVVIPVVANTEARQDLPRWLGATQIGDYATETGVLGIVSSIATYRYDPEFSRKTRPPDPVPGLAIWFRVLDWNKQALEEFDAAAKREGLSPEVLDENIPDEILIRRATSASLLVISFDGTATDGLSHYICGAVVSRPKAGYGRLLPRRILMLQPPNVGTAGLIADSLMRCQDTAVAVRTDRVRDETAKFGQQYRNWLQTPRPRKHR
jgi:hypothetical protein